MHRQMAAGFFLLASGSLAADAADISNIPAGGQHGTYGNYQPYGARIEPLIVYDYEPGVIVRSYWDTPWATRHYFPATGRRPKVGRLERDPGRRSTRAEDYYRFWSVSSVFAPELQPVNARPYAIAPAPGSYGR